MAAVDAFLLWHLSSDIVLNAARQNCLQLFTQSDTAVAVLIK